MTLWYRRGRVVAKLSFDAPGVRTVRAELSEGEVRVSMPLLRISGHRGDTTSQLTIVALQSGTAVASGSCDPDASDKPSVSYTETIDERRYDTSFLPDCAFTVPKAGLTDLQVTLDLPRVRELRLELKQ